MTSAKKDGKVVREWNDKKFGTFVLPGQRRQAGPGLRRWLEHRHLGQVSKNPELSKELLKIIFSAEYQQKLGGAGLGPANTDYVSSLGDDQFAKALIDSASNSKLTPAAPGWAAVEASMVLEEFFGKIEDADRPRGAGEGVRRQDHPDAQRQVIEPPRRPVPPRPAAGDPPPPEDPAMTTGTTTAPTTPNTAPPQRRNRKRKNRLPLILIVPALVLLVAALG